MRIEKPSPSSNLSKNIAGFILVAILAGFLFWLYTATQHPSAQNDTSSMNAQSSLPVLKIANFVGQPEVYSKKEKRWVPLSRGAEFTWGDQIRTDADSEVDIRADDQVVLRLKANSEAERKKAPSGAGYYQIHLSKGFILGSVDKTAGKEKWLEISTPAVVASIRGTVFGIRADSGATQKSWVGVMHGLVQVTGVAQKDSVDVKSLQQIETNPEGTLTNPIRVSNAEWDSMKEAYDFIERSVEDEEAELDLSQQAGGIFANVFDHGTFFTPEVGYAWRHFHYGKGTDGQIVLDLDYDVFPVGSFVGMYMKVRDADIDDFEALQMRVKRVPGEDAPDAFRIEVKSKGQVVRAFSPKYFKQEWQTMQFPLRADKKAPISEIAFVISNGQVGEHTRGSLRFADIQLIPKKVVPPAVQPDAPAAGADQTQQAPKA